MILLDTSALAKLLVEEAESAGLRAELSAQSQAGENFAISSLATTELRRLAIRLAVESGRVDPILTPFRVLRLTEGILQLAGRIPHRHLRTLDAIHLATALCAGTQALMTYDRHQSEAAVAEGLTVLNPS